MEQKAVQINNNFAFVDSQVIQITPLTVKGLKKEISKLTIEEQKQLLSAYSKYELDYFTEELNIEVINPHNQWVAIKSRYWFFWYFRVGKTPGETKPKMRAQLFASSIISGKVLTINATILNNSDASKAGKILNQMMESLIVKPTN